MCAKGPFRLYFLIKTSCLNFLPASCRTMDTPSGNNSQTTPSSKLSLAAFLENKKPSRSNKASINSLETATEEQQTSKVMPAYSFDITGYSIGEHVEYSITLKEEFTVLRRKVTRNYKFTTRYSKLERLDERLGGKGLPKKKWFGNKSVEFVEKRKVELQKYLNCIALCRKTEFLHFLRQIKNGDFNHGFSEKFSIE